jgi:carbonic anhydrase
MAPTPVQENLVNSNKVYASSFTQGDLALPPAKKYAVGSSAPPRPLTALPLSRSAALISALPADIVPVTCMDARIDPAAAYGISLGDAHVIRNAGGNAKDALRSLVISEQLLGTTEIVLVKHTGCGMLTFKNEDAATLVRQNLGDKAAEGLNAFNADFQPFPDLEEAVKSDVEFLKGSSLIPDSVAISGWVYEVETGKVKSVV